MNILILGGTGAMGVPLVNILSKNNTITVTSRKAKPSSENIKYIQGDAHEQQFLSNLLSKEYDAIIDFMIYGTDQFKSRFGMFLDNCNQYFYFSSSRVYADSLGEKITEESPRLLDVCKDTEYLETDEYALAKAREEDLLFNCGKNNWTIIRPYITYNSQRLQLGVYEKENWLYRALHGRTIVMPNDIAGKKTTITYGHDVAEAIALLIGNEHAFGEAFHIVTNESLTWRDILNVYVTSLQEITGKLVPVQFIDNSNSLQEIWNRAQIKYDRLFNRTFDNSKLIAATHYSNFISVKDGLSKCLTECLKAPAWGQINMSYEAWADRLSKCRTPLKEINGSKTKIKYLLRRYMP